MPAGLASENSLGNLELPGTPDTLTLQGYRYCGVDQILVWPVAPRPGVQAGGAGAGCGVQAAQRGGAGGERQPGEQRGGERGVGGGQEAQAVPPPLGGKVHLPHKTTSTGPYRSCAALLDISNPCLVWLVLVLFGWF